MLTNSNISAATDHLISYLPVFAIFSQVHVQTNDELFQLSFSLTASVELG